MNVIRAEPWTVERFLLWEDRQEGRHEFDGRRIIPMAGGSIAHQRIVRNLLIALIRLLDRTVFEPLHEMRLGIGTKIRYPDLCILAGTMAQTVRTLTDAVVIMEVLSDDTAATDRVEKLIDYAALPGLRCYVLLEQAAIGATVFRRNSADGPWIASALTDGALTLPEIGIELPLADIYAGLSFDVSDGEGGVNARRDLDSGP